MPVQEYNDELIYFLRGEFVSRRMPFGLRGSLGGWWVWEYDGLDASTEVVIADGPSEPLYGLSYNALIRSSGGVVVRTEGLIGINANEDIFNDGTNSVNLRVNANGSVDIRRVGGALTYKVQLLLNWM